MLRITATFDLTILYLVAANAIAILAYVLIGKRRVRRRQGERDAIAAAVIDFFRRNDEQVSVQCITSEIDGRFVVLIDSLPSKRFRHSHIIAVMVANHVRTVCAAELEGIFWRFPIKAVHEDAPAQRADTGLPEGANGTDGYLDEGVSRLRDLPQYEVTESSWDKFQEYVKQKEPA